MGCSKLEIFLYPTVRLLLYLDKLDIDEFYDVCIRTSLPKKKVIETKCGNMQSAIGYLLNYTNLVEDPLLFTFDKAYHFELQGFKIKDLSGKRTPEDFPTNTSHSFGLINNGIDWLMIDSYIGCRGFTCRVVSIDSILSIISQLKNKFDDKLWMMLTGCENDDINTNMVDIKIYQYDYSISDIKNIFTELVNLAKHRLNNESIGLSDEYLVLMASDLNPRTANDYLNFLANMAH